MSDRLNAFFSTKQAFILGRFYCVGRNLQLMLVSHDRVDWWLKIWAGSWKVEGLNPAWVDS